MLPATTAKDRAQIGCVLPVWDLPNNATKMKKQLAKAKWKE
jgi:hypothetical protein